MAQKGIRAPAVAIGIFAVPEERLYDSAGDGAGAGESRRF